MINVNFYKKRLKELGMTQKNLAVQMGISPALLGLIINGKCSLSVERMTYLCMFLKCSANELIWNEDIVPENNSVINKAFIKERLKELGMTQKELGDRIGLDQPRFSYILSGKRPMRIEILILMCDALECEPNEVIIIPERRYQDEMV